jgi:CDP-6-deoxy-D-xylo-4-hexulose-3-dehydrase
LNRIIRSIRDWGRGCWGGTGKYNTCGKRFSQKLGNLPMGYDHKYTFSHIGYNLKITDLQSSIGVAQIQKLPSFVSKRRENFAFLKKRLEEENLDDFFILPRATKGSKPAWFGFPLTISKDKISRRDLLLYLEKNGIATRLLFGGNITKQPYFLNYQVNYRIIGNLENTDKIMNDSFWIGIYPGLEQHHLEYIVNNFKNFISNIK